MIVSKRQFKLFKDTCNIWIDKLGLTQYQVEFVHKELETGYAEIRIDELGKAATIFLTNTNSKFQSEFFDVEKIAIHEVCHLLIHRLRWLGESRYIERDDLDEEWEAIVRRLVRIVR